MKKKSAVFLIHPRDHRDLVERFWWIRIIPPSITDLMMAKLSGSYGYTICDKINIFDKLDFYLLGITMKIHQAVSRNNIKVLRAARRRIHEAASYSQNCLDAGTIGLGALTAPVTDGGKWLVNQEDIYSSITHGGTYTTLVAVDGIKKIIALSGLSNPLIAIVGAYGIIGAALSKILSRDYELIMMGRNKAKLERLYGAVDRKGAVTTSIHKIKTADIVITTTNYPDAFMKSESFKKGAIIYDIAQPANVDKRLLKERPDILRIDGALVKVPGIDINFNMRTGKDSTFACLVETILIALEDIKGHFVGEINVDYLDQFKSIGQKYGFFHSDFTQFGRKITDEEFLRKRT